MSALRTIGGVVAFGIYMVGTGSLTFLFFVLVGRL